jgi:lipopolysaccharide biosynthesis protein
VHHLASRLRPIRRLRTAINLVTEDPSLTLFFRVIREKLTRPFLIAPQNWTPDYVVETPGLGSPENLPKIAIAAHLFYAEYVKKMSSALETFPFPFDLMITTSSDQLAEKCRDAFSGFAQNLDVRLVPNRGRNLGPLFVEFSSNFKNYDVVVHVHSKKSLYLQEDVAVQWSNELWESLLSDPKLVGRAVDIFMRDPKVGIYYPLTSLVPLAAFSWGKSGKIGRQWARKHKVKHVSGYVPFPAGGMFWFRPNAIAPILESHFEYSDFPEESGQVDATTQHAVERLIGTVPLALGYKHLVYHVDSDTFTTDTSYAGKLLSILDWMKKRRAKASR